MKVTEPRLNTLIDNLNTLICEDNLLTRQEREDLVRAVAAIGAMKARVSMKKAATPSAAKSKAEKKERVFDPRFPHAGEPWQEEEGTLLLDALEDVPDEQIETHLFWLSEKLGRTPYSVACKVATLRHIPEDWKDQFREISDKIRLSGLSISDYLKQNGTDRNA
ncbi:TPA: DNA-binding protein [Klebsiella pneumoniae]|uniref:DNA-binding protein n=1 Tax=Klebsiella pneumoniae TaxID=573 RepID=UPI0010371E5C|nr:DNA-binding protein [Klebsiella pneumoniae]QBI37371.1 DNA-binding protein [Klebsiella pneumoniae]HBS5970811.1 DNA-binding protein [Klebsiella pneumoniae]HBZ4199692.1 DNA-binding protein [Klebsiella pneumoniae]HDZ1496425.1 DNA-binding protein [Klebsiella pneumoniae]HDZ2232591.1 DNA-binding protein [Klebsiella pneumoniae]